MRTLFFCLVLAASSIGAQAHDIWVETNSPLVMTGEIAYIDLKLGNHGNDHRDFKLAGKVSLETCDLSVIDPTGHSIDLKPKLSDTGFTPKEGYWTTRYTTTQAGSHVVASTSETVRGTMRSNKSAKAYFLATNASDDLSNTPRDHDKPLGHSLEIVPLTDLWAAMGPGKPFRVQVLLHSKPLNAVRVTFVPRGTELAEGFDERFERETDKDGIATFTPHEGNVVLVVVHHLASDENGAGYDNTKYSATLTIAVPQHCPKGVIVRSSN